MYSPSQRSLIQIYYSSVSRCKFPEPRDACVLFPSLLHHTSLYASKRAARASGAKIKCSSSAKAAAASPRLHACMYIKTPFNVPLEYCIYLKLASHRLYGQAGQSNMKALLCSRSSKNQGSWIGHLATRRLDVDGPFKKFYF
jgi:hypothetical protein